MIDYYKIKSGLQKKPHTQHQKKERKKKPHMCLKGAKMRMPLVRTCYLHHTKKQLQHVVGNICKPKHPSGEELRL